MSTPAWVYDEVRYLGYGWWVTKMRSLQAWEYAGSPASFQSRGIYIHRESLINVCGTLMLSRERILSLFAELNHQLCAQETRGDIFIVGGAAMAVAYEARPATRDVDGIWQPSGTVRDVALPYWKTVRLFAPVLS